MREGESPGTLLCPRAQSSMPEACTTDWLGLSACGSPDRGAPLSSWCLSHFVSQHIPTIHSATCWLPFRTRPEPSLRLFLGPDQQMPQCSCHGPKRMLSFLLVHPAASPGSPCLPPVAFLPTPHCTSQARGALAGCQLHRWWKCGATHQRCGDARKAGCDIWKRFSCLVHIANMPQAAAPAHRSSSRHQGHRCPQDSKPGRIQARLRAKILTLG